MNDADTKTESSIEKTFVSLEHFVRHWFNKL